MCTTKQSTSRLGTVCGFQYPCRSWTVRPTEKGRLGQGKGNALHCSHHRHLDSVSQLINKKLNLSSYQPTGTSARGYLPSPHYSLQPPFYIKADSLKGLDEFVFGDRTDWGRKQRMVLAKILWDTRNQIHWMGAEAGKFSVPMRAGNGGSFCFQSITPCWWITATRSTDRRKTPPSDYIL